MKTKCSCVLCVRVCVCVCVRMYMYVYREDGDSKLTSIFKSGSGKNFTEKLYCPAVRHHDHHLHHPPLLL